MARSQEQIQKEIRIIDDRIEAYRKNIAAFGSTPNAQEVEVIKGLRAEIQKIVLTQRVPLEKELAQLNVAQSSSTTTQPTKTLNDQLKEVNQKITVVEDGLKSPRLTIAEKNKLRQELQILQQQRKEINQKLLRLTETNNYAQRVPYSPSVPPPAADPNPNPTNNGLQGATEQTRRQATRSNQNNNQVLNDWRVKLYLAPGTDGADGYLYNDTNNKLLSPLKKTGGVIFPYTPAIQVSYNAHYDPFDVTHSNYKLYAYKNSSVENISISGEFTAQDTEEANYLLAVIHFFRSVTKMFYGQDQKPIRGTPPPICYLDGFGTYQFNKHPLLITAFNYSLPTDVDYIRATPYLTAPAGTPQTSQGTTNVSSNPRAEVLNGRGVNSGGVPTPPDFKKLDTSVVPTYVPTKIQIQISAIAVVSRKDISDNFSLKEYATGNLLQGKTNEKIGAGIW